MAAPQFIGRGAAPLAMNLAGIGALAAGTSAVSASTSGYKAVICLFMNGGNDSHNWVVPLDSVNYSEYAAARSDLSISRARLQSIVSTTQERGRSFGMPLELAPLRTWYESGRAAIIANVGTLVRPIGHADYRAGIGLPPKLFSHNDQAALWQSMQPEGAPSGWGGRMGDILMSANQYPVFTAVSAGGNAVFLSGERLAQYQVSANGPVQINATKEGWRAGSTAVPAALRSILQTTSSPNAYETEYLKVVQRSLGTAATLDTALGATAIAALPSAPITLPNGSSLILSNDPLAKQLRVVAQMIAAAPALGMRRQVFMVSMNGFDTHSGQSIEQPRLMSRVAQSVDWFLATIQARGLLNSTLLFTASDFGRTLISNGDGCDHGWGGHHFVFGGGTRGREIYGRFPVTALNTADDVGSGRLLPSTGVTQLAATIGSWMGLSEIDLGTVLPNVGNFSSRPGFV